jgi:membrane-bound lytic murein transglycosylase D
MNHMRKFATICAVAAAGTMLLAGCDDSAKQHAKVRAPAQAPAPAPVPQEVRERLPFPDRVSDLSALRGDTRPAIEKLLDAARASFDAGQKEYKAGNLDAARKDFNRSMDLILNSGFQVDYDLRLSDLFDQIGETLNAYEMVAQKGAQEEEEEENPGTPAPMDELSELTLPPGDPRLLAKAEKELMTVPHDIPLTVNDSVLQYLSFFTTARGRMIAEHGLDRMGRYSDMIRRVLKEEGVPQDLIYLAQAESAFQPQAVSRAGARGIWQFMPFRGEEYDLDRTFWIDERSDPEKATRAAAHHMRDLYHMFGDWYLVMAAYNAGPMGVVKAVERTGYADFWELQRRRALPKQTQNYVPIILALTLVAKDPALYGVQVSPERPPAVDPVRLGHSIGLHLVADATGADLDDLRLLNPQLLRTVTPGDPQFVLLLPAGTGKKLQDNIQQVPVEKWTSWRLHEVESGESLASIARRYRVTVSSIESANHLKPRAELSAGFLVSVPTAPAAVRLVHYRVQRGDTLEGIAGRFDVTVAQIKKWNNIHGPKVSRGTRLRIYAGGGSEPALNGGRSKSAANTSPAPAVRNVSTSAEPSGKVQHHVRAGETLYSIARTYRTTVSRLKDSNPFLASRSLEAGDVLTIER